MIAINWVNRQVHNQCLTISYWLMYFIFLKMVATISEPDQIYFLKIKKYSILSWCVEKIMLKIHSEISFFKDLNNLTFSASWCHTFSEMMANLFYNWTNYRTSQIRHALLNQSHKPYVLVTVYLAGKTRQERKNYTPI